MDSWRDLGAPRVPVFEEAELRYHWKAPNSGFMATCTVHTAKLIVTKVS